MSGLWSATANVVSKPEKSYFTDLGYQYFVGYPAQPHSHNLKNLKGL